MREDYPAVLVPPTVELSRLASEGGRPGTDDSRIGPWAQAASVSR